MNDRGLATLLSQIAHNEQGRRIVRQIVRANHEHKVVKVSHLARFVGQQRARPEYLDTLVDVVSILLQEVHGKDQELIPAQLNALETAQDEILNGLLRFKLVF